MEMVAIFVAGLVIGMLLQFQGKRLLDGYIERELQAQCTPKKGNLPDEKESKVSQEKMLRQLDELLSYSGEIK